MRSRSLRWPRATAVLGLALLSPLGAPAVAQAPNGVPAEAGSTAADEAARPSATPAARPARRNVLFYLIDTCRADAMSLYGSKNKTTPFLEKLAESSVVFEHCYAQGAWTKPSMAALLSSRYPSEVGIHNMFQRLSGRVTTFPEVFRRAGYRTAGFSANPIMGRLSNYTQGFSKFVESQRVNRADPIRFASGSASKLNEYVFEWLDEKSEAPALLYVHAVDPHEDYEPAPRYLKLFADPAKEDAYRRDWKKLLRTRPAVPGNHLVQWNFDKAGVEPGPFVAFGRQLYDADILATDEQIEKLWERLQKKEWGEDTIVVITSDHGEEFFEHGGTSHAYSLYEEMIRVPLLIHAPGLIPGGRRIAQPVQSIDIYPTLLELAGLKPPEEISGRSLVPLMRAPEAWKPEPLFSERTEDGMGARAGSPMGIAMTVRSGKWKYTLNLKPPTHQVRARHELFDMAADPGEKNNLAEQRRDLVARFEQQVMEWSARNHGLVVAAEAPTEAIDAATIERLKQLGYVGNGESADAAAAQAAKMIRVPLLVRAVLESDATWQLYALDPEGEGTGRRPRKFGKYAAPRNGIVRGEERAELLGVVTEGIAPGDAPFRPVFGVRAGYRGHTADLFLCPTSRRMNVYLDAVGHYESGATPLLSVGLSAAAMKSVQSIFAGEGL